MESTFWPTVFLFAGGQAIFLAIVFLIHKRLKRARLYLGAILLFFGISLVYNYLYWTSSFLSYPHFMAVNIPIYYLFGPLFLLYLDSIRPRSILQKTAFLHFIPAALLAGYYAKYFVLSASEKIELVQTRTPVPKVDWLSWASFLGQDYKIYCSHMVIYLLAMFVLLWKERTFAAVPNNSEQWSYHQNWLLAVIGCYALYTVSFITYFPLSTYSFFDITHDYIISGVMTISVFSIAVMGYHFPKIISKGAIYQDLVKIKYGQSVLPEGIARSILESLELAMQEKELFRIQGVKIQEVADQLNVPTHSLSQVINNAHGMTFNQYINQCRIDLVKASLSDRDQSHLSIIDLAYEAGFGNKTSFNTAFKKMVGMSPSAFRKAQIDKDIVRSQ